MLPDEWLPLLGERYVLPEERVLVERVELPLERDAVLLLVERVLVALDVVRVELPVERVVLVVREGEVVPVERVLLPDGRVVAVVADERVLFTSVPLLATPERLLASDRVAVLVERADDPVRLAVSERVTAVCLLP